MSNFEEAKVSSNEIMTNNERTEKFGSSLIGNNN
jgi:hypothetical protein